MKGIRLVLLAAIAVAATLVPTAGAAEQPGRYIVVFKDFAAPQAAPLATELASRFGARPEHVYEHALKGFSVTLSSQQADSLAADARVRFVEADAEVTITTTQLNATWGLDRIDQRNLPLNTTFRYTATGAGVTAYVIDTGIRFDHVDFGGRAVSGFDAIDGGPADDCHGHGTHVSGTVGGTTWGVAKEVTLVGVRVLNCAGSGTNAQVIAGVDWVTGDHASNEPAVANMSLGGSPNAGIDLAVENSIADGISYSIAAGNENQSACNKSPARVATAMTMGATKNTDARAVFSNWGDCVDWFAPGENITSAWNTSPTATNTISGTSMASPHNAGVSALLLERRPSLSPAQVRDTLFAQTTKGIVTSANTVNNHLLFTRY